MFQNFTADNEGEENNTGHSIRVSITEASPTVHEAKINEIQDFLGKDYTLTILLYVTLPIIALGLFSNGAIFWFLCCRIKKTKYTVYVLNLAIADFSVLFCHIIYFVFHMVISANTSLDSKFHLVFGSLTFFGFNTSFFLLTAISVERYVALYFPLCYRFNRPKHLSTILCVVLWALSFIMVGMDYLCWQEYTSFGGSHQANIFIAIVFVLFLPVMVFCSFSLFIKLSRYPQSKSPARFYRTVIGTVVLFLILAVPHKVMCLIQYMQPTKYIHWTIVNCFFLLNLINSCLNPFVYFFVGRQKQRHSKDPLHVVIYRSCHDEALET